MAETLSEKEWTILLQRIKTGDCTPFLGAGACYGVLPLGSDIAREWAERYGYPLEDRSDLVRVAQFLAVEYDPMFAKEEMLARLQGSNSPNFREPGEPHGVLADLPLPVYLTTNYDDFMVLALTRRYRDARRELCRWAPWLAGEPLQLDAGYSPTVANPVVYHLHGHSGVPASLVLTEDDYLRFLASIAHDANLLPTPIQRALTGSSLLFIGYRLADWNFRILFRSMDPMIQHLSVAVLLPPGDTEGERLKAQRYLTHYYENMKLRVYWGTARDFCAELRRRWNEFAQET